MNTPTAHDVSGEPAWLWQHEFQPVDRVPEWLLDQASLTDRLVTASAGGFAVMRLQQCWQNPRPTECDLLNLPAQDMALIREVQLMCAGTPWVFARSVIPTAACTGELSKLRDLGNQSLGELLFSRPDLERSPFQLAIIAGSSPTLPDNLRHDGESWARRCRFTVGDKSLMVSEIFLPPFQPWT